MISGINSGAHTLRFGPGSIRQMQGKVKVRRCSTPCSRFNGVEDRQGSICSNARVTGIQFAPPHGNLYRLFPDFTHKGSKPKAALSGFKAETVVRCKRESSHGRILIPEAKTIPGTYAGSDENSGVFEDRFCFAPVL